MSLISNSIINKYKKVIDKASYIYEANKIILHNAGFQHKCLFECIIYPEKINIKSFSKDSLKQGASIALGVQLMRTFLYAINDIQLVSFEYDRVNGFSFIKDINYTDSISMTFLETQLGLVKNYFLTWLDEIAYYEPKTREYYLRDDQSQSERTCLIIPQQKDYLPSLVWIKIDGLKIKSITGIEYSHEDSDIEKITIEFKADNIRLINALSSIL